MFDSSDPIVSWPGTESFRLQKKLWRYRRDLQLQSQDLPQDTSNRNRIHALFLLFLHPRKSNRDRQFFQDHV